MRAKGGVVGCPEGKIPLFCTQRGWFGRHLSEKQQVKDGGACRVIWTSTRTQQKEKLRIPCIESQIQPHFHTRI